MNLNSFMNGFLLKCFFFLIFVCRCALTRVSLFPKQHCASFLGAGIAIRGYFHHHPGSVPFYSSPSLLAHRPPPQAPFSATPSTNRWTLTFLQSMNFDLPLEAAEKGDTSDSSNVEFPKLLQRPLGFL